MSTPNSHTMTRISRVTDDRLKRMSEISGIPKTQIVDRAVEAFEPRVVEAAKALGADAASEQAIDQEFEPAQTSAVG